MDICSKARRWSLTILLAAGAILAGASSSQAEEYYYCMIFGSQSSPKLLRYTHTWATFIRVVGQGPDLGTYQVYSHTLSWYPASMKVRVLAAKPEPGVNLTLEQTLAAVYANKESVTLWGPFVVTPEVYNRVALGDTGVDQEGAVGLSERQC